MNERNGKRRRRDPIRVSAALDKFFRKTGMTQAEFAKRIGVGDSDVSRYRSGETTPSVSILVSMQRELGISLDDLVRA